MVTEQDRANVTLQAWQSLRDLPPRERMKRIDELSLDVLYDHQLRSVAAAMYEPEPLSVNKTALAIHGGYFAFIAFGGLLLWEMIR